MKTWSDLLVEGEDDETRIQKLAARVKELEDSLNATYHTARIWREKAKELEGELAEAIDHIGKMTNSREWRPRYTNSARKFLEKHK